MQLVLFEWFKRLVTSGPANYNWPPPYERTCEPDLEISLAHPHWSAPACFCWADPALDAIGRAVAALEL